MLGPAVALWLVAAADGSSRGWAHFSASYRSQTVVEVEIGTSDARATPLAYFMRRTIRRPGVANQIAEADSRSCPAIRSILQAMENLQVPSPVAPFLHGEDMVLTADGVLYELTAPSQYPGAGEGDIRIGSNAGTPLAAWVEESLKELAPCLPPALPVHK